MCRTPTCGRTVFTQNSYLVLLQKSVPAQMCQLFLDVRNNKRQVDGFVRELTFAKRFYQHFLSDKVVLEEGGRGAEQDHLSVFQHNLCVISVCNELVIRVEG